MYNYLQNLHAVMFLSNFFVCYLIVHKLLGKPLGNRKIHRLKY